MRARRAVALIAALIAGAGATPTRGVPAFAALSLAGAESTTIARDVSVQEAYAVVAQRSALLHLARVRAYPHLVGDYSLSAQAGTTPNSTLEQHLLSVGAGISLNDILASAQATRSAAGDVLASQRQADAAVLAARERAVRLYYGALSAVALETFRAAELAGALRDRNAAALRARSGEAPELDVIRADVTLEQARADLALAAAQRVDAIGALASATGVEAASLATITTEPGPPATRGGVDAYVSRALAQRPEIAALMALVAARRADVSLAKQSALPSVTASGGVQGGADTGQPIHGSVAGVHVDLPLGSPASSNTQIARAQLDAVSAQLIDVRRTIALEVAAAFGDAHAADASAQAAAAASEQAARALRAVELGYREGASSSLDVADARRTYVQASVNAVVAEYLRAQAYAILEVIVP